MKPTKIGYEKRYSDDSGVEFGIRFDSETEDIAGGKGVIEFERVGTISFPLSEITWILDVLYAIQRTRLEEE